MRQIILLISLLIGPELLFSQEMVRAKFLVDGRFYSEMPESVSSLPVVTMCFVKDNNGNSLNKILLPEGFIIDPEDTAYAIPFSHVLNARQFLINSRKRSFTFEVSVNDNLRSGLHVGDTIPHFRVKDIKGKTWSRRRLHGKPTIINFWYIGCGPCLYEIPELNEMMRLCPKANYLAVTWNTPAEIQKILTTKPFLFTHIANDKVLIQLFGIRQTPTTILLDKHCVIRKICSGTTKQKRDAVVRMLRQISEE